MQAVETKVISNSNVAISCIGKGIQYRRDIIENICTCTAYYYGFIDSNS